MRFEAGQGKDRIVFTFVLVLVVMGLAIGGLARLIVPGKQAMSLPFTLLLGVVGTLISGFIGRWLFGADGRFGSWIFALVITVGLVIGAERLRIGARKAPPAH